MATQTFTDLDFNEIKTNLKNYLKAQNQFSDYDFEGSNMNVLLDVLAYNTFQNNFYTNMAISEMFLDSAQIKDSVISHAKELNYLPRSRRSAQAVLTIEFSPDDSPSSITIPARTKFLARCGTSTYSFWTDQSYICRQSANGAYIINNVDVFEGRYINEYFEVDGTSTQRFVLSNDTIDTSSIEVFIKDSSSSTTETEYTYKANIYDVNSTDKVFYLQPYRDNRYEITFGDDTFGSQPINGNIIHVRYRVTNGDEANGINTFDIASDIDGITSTEYTQTASFGGAERESLESIRFFAPKSIQIQERAITENDYSILLRNKFPEIQAVDVYGGEKLDPPQFGRVVLSVYLNDESTVRSDIKNKYKTYLLDHTALTVEPVIESAKFMYVDVACTVYYNPNRTTKSGGALETIAANAVSTYSTTYLGDFKKTLKASKLTTAIDDSNDSFTSSLLDLNMIIELTPELNTNTSFSFSFNNEIDADVTYSDTQLFDYTPAVYSNTFTYQNKIVKLQDNGSGRLDLIESTETSKTIAKRNVGSVNYTTGAITINTISIQDYTTAIKVFAKPKKNNIEAANGRVLKIRTSDIDVTAIAKRE